MNTNPGGSPMSDSTATLAQIAADRAMRAAAAYVAKHAGLNRGDLTGELTAALKRRLLTAVPAALDDAREALACGMSAVAEATFLASMALAGVAAAKEVLQ